MDRVKSPHMPDSIVVAGSVSRDVEAAIAAYALQKEWSKSKVIAKILTRWADEHYPDRDRDMDAEGDADDQAIGTP